MIMKEKEFAMAARTRMLDLKTNFKVGTADAKCWRCETEEETQDHLHCPALSDTCPVQGVPLYSDVLEENPKKISIISRILSEKLKLLIKPSAPV